MDTEEREGGGGGENMCLGMSVYLRACSNVWKASL